MQVPGDHNFNEEQDYYRDNYPRGYRSNVGGAGIITRKGCAIDVQTELSAEDILWPLSTGVLGGVSPSTSDTSAKTWSHNPQLTTAVQTVDSATVEYLEGDGTTNHYYAECGYALTESFKIDWAYNQAAKLSWKMFGRARQSDTPTGSLTPYSTREVLASNACGVYWDTSWAGLGGTQLQGILRSGSIEVKTGLGPDYTMDARTDVDMTGHKVGVISAVLNLVMELDATGAARITNWRANSLVFVRLKNLGSLAGAATVYRTVQIDGCYRFTAAPAKSDDGSQRLVAVSLESVLDTTSNKTLEFTAINKLASL